MCTDYSYVKDNVYRLLLCKGQCVQITLVLRLMCTDYSCLKDNVYRSSVGDSATGTAETDS